MTGQHPEAMFLLNTAGGASGASGFVTVILWEVKSTPPVLLPVAFQ